MTGNGLTNGYPVGGINGHDVRLILTEPLEYLNIFFQVSQFIKKLPYDILTAGKSVAITTLLFSATLNVIDSSHELTDYTVAFDM